MTTGNMDRTLFLGKEVEDWFEGFEKELRKIDEEMEKAGYPKFDVERKQILEILGEEPNKAKIELEVSLRLHRGEFDNLTGKQIREMLEEAKKEPQKK